MSVLHVLFAFLGVFDEDNHEIYSTFNIMTPFLANSIFFPLRGSNLPAQHRLCRAFKSNTLSLLLSLLNDH